MQVQIFRLLVGRVLGQCLRYVRYNDEVHILPRISVLSVLKIMMSSAVQCSVVQSQSTCSLHTQLRICLSNNSIHHNQCCTVRTL
jgi:hypothetical protein